MLYIICALKSEAQAFVDKYKLTKSKQNSEVTLIVSGIGRESMFNASKKILPQMSKTDIIVNIGICGANKSYKIGQLIDGFANNLSCVNEAVTNDSIYELVDMESAGFIQATKAIKNRYIFKIVSDHFEPHKVTKEATKQLIFNAIDDINVLIYNKGK
ncbi:hypothetical protein [Sulfurimonas sp.]|uniref:hypothetical protein n=1 Tax=Sulfurimonas sp. TaxID=2022749 RepID=UPI002AB27D8B|nr:hypothetical protein [Sulfurimonas sp.]